MKSEYFYMGIITALLIATLIVSIQSSNNLKAYNKHMCKTYGYYDDCRTPLPVELRYQ
jgi:Na+/H+-dicarboxylate symporter